MSRLPEVGHPSVEVLALSREQGLLPRQLASIRHGGFDQRVRLQLGVTTRIIALLAEPEVTTILHPGPTTPSVAMRRWYHGAYGVDRTSTRQPDVR